MFVGRKARGKNVGGEKPGGGAWPWKHVEVVWRKKFEEDCDRGTEGRGTHPGGRCGKSVHTKC